MYRKDVLERICYMFKKGDTKPNFAKLAREMGRDCRTVKRAYEAGHDIHLDDAGIVLLAGDKRGK